MTKPIHVLHVSFCCKYIDYDAWALAHHAQG